MAATNKLSEYQIRNAKPKASAYKLADGGGMFLLVRINGSKYWRMKFSFEGKEKQLSLGVYPEVSLSEARKDRESIKRQIRQGINPSQARKIKKLEERYNAGNSFEARAKEWLEFKRNGWTEKHAEDVWRSLETNIFPALGAIPIADINTLMLREPLERIEKRGSLEQARRMRQRCSAIFRHSIAAGVCENDPADVLKDILKQPVKGNFAALPIEEMPEFLYKLKRYNTTRQTELAIQFLFLTFVRTKELCGARWEEIDIRKRVWNIPKERMKRRRAHYVPLSDQAIAVLEELRELTGHRDLIFPKHGNPREQMSNATILRVIHRIGYKDRMTGHGIRSVASTAINESMLFHPDAIERQLSHEQNDEIRAAYNKAEHIQDRIKMMQWWADKLDELQGLPNLSAIKARESNVKAFKFGG